AHHSLASRRCLAGLPRLLEGGPLARALQRLGRRRRRRRLGLGGDLPARFQLDDLGRRTAGSALRGTARPGVAAVAAAAAPRRSSLEPLRHSGLVLRAARPAPASDAGAGDCILGRFLRLVSPPPPLAGPR